MQFSQLLSQFQSPIEAELRVVLASHPEPLYRMMEYALGWVDEQGSPLSSPSGPYLHGALCLMVCRSLGGDTQRAMSAAIAVELVHHFSLIHDDIQDGNPQRGHRSTVWWVWGPGQAINAGDGMHALARLALFRLAEGGVPAEQALQATRLLDEACLQLCEGQYQDLLFQERVSVAQESYLKMVEDRTGALLGCAAELGALLAGAGKEARDACREAGLKLGLAVQVHQDVQDLLSTAVETVPSGDILNKKKSLPVIFALEKAGAQVKRELGTLYLKRVLNPTDVPRLVQILDEVGAREFCREVAEQAAEEALAALARAGISDQALGEFRELTGSILTP